MAPDEMLHIRLLHEALRDAARQRLSDPQRALVAADLSLVFCPPQAPSATAPSAPAPVPVPLPEGLRAHGQVTGGGRSVCFCEAELRDATQRPVARAMGTFRYGPA